MRGVAARTHGRYGEPAFHEPLTVNAFRIALDDLVFVSLISHGSFLPFAVTACAENRNIGRERHRLRIDFSLHGVRPMAFFARRRVGIVLRR